MKPMLDPKRDLNSVVLSTFLYKSHCLEQLSTLFATSIGVNECWCMWPLSEPGGTAPTRREAHSALSPIASSIDVPPGSSNRGFRGTQALT